MIKLTCEKIWLHVHIWRHKMGPLRNISSTRQFFQKMSRLTFFIMKFSIEWDINELSTTILKVLKHWISIGGQNRNRGRGDRKYQFSHKFSSAPLFFKIDQHFEGAMSASKYYRFWPDHPPPLRQEVQNVGVFFTLYIRCLKIPFKIH